MGLSGHWFAARFRLGRQLRRWPTAARLLYGLLPFLRAFPAGRTIVYVCACNKRIQVDPYGVPDGDPRAMRCESCRERLGP